MQRFHLTHKTVLVVKKGDLTKCHTDAIVNAVNEKMLGGGGVDGAIHKAAGPELLKACKAVEEVSKGVRCPTGEARITPGFNLPCRFVIHTVGPKYAVGTGVHHRRVGQAVVASTEEQAERLLGSCYASSLKLANEQGLSSIAFPAISCGVFSYPAKDAARVSLRAAKEKAGKLSEIQFVLWQDPLLDAWLAEAEANFERVKEGAGDAGDAGEAERQVGEEEQQQQQEEAAVEGAAGGEMGDEAALGSAGAAVASEEAGIAAGRATEALVASEKDARASREDAAQEEEEPASPTGKHAKKQRKE